jgi:hypothetical protein
MRTLLVLTLCAACTSGKPPIEDENVGVPTSDIKADLKSNTTFLGDVIYGQQLSVAYNKKPRYRSVRFAATAGDIVDVWVRGVKPTPGHAAPDAMVWLYDYTGALVDMNDDADGTTLDAHVHATLPPSNGFYYVYLRDYSLHTETFRVQVDGAPDPSTADAEAAYNAAADHLDSFQIKPAALPPGAKAIFDQWSALPSNGVTAYYLTDGGADIYVVALNPEEEWLVDLFDESGNFLVHGWDGDGGPAISGWGSYPSWDPTK